MATAEALAPATSHTGPGIEFDEQAFAPMRIMEVHHRLVGHPLLELESLVELAKRMEKNGSFRFHNDKAEAGTSFVNATKTHKVDLPPHEIVSRIETAGAWLALHHVQRDPVYRELVDEVLDHVRPRVEAKDPGMHHRAGWIFVTSPGAVTPYHMDHEHNFILQVRGKKTLNTWDPLDRTVVTERSLELFHFKDSRDLVVYKEEFQPKARVFHLEPGLGGYMPSTTPHWVKNGDNVSITVSFTYYTDMTWRRKNLHRGNYRLRAMGMEPTPVGDQPGRDLVKFPLIRAEQAVRDVAKRLLGREVERHHLKYAKMY
jgi:hypothetical protein